MSDAEGSLVRLEKVKVTAKGRAYEYWVLRWKDAAGKRRSRCLGRTDKVSPRRAENARRLKDAELLANPAARSIGRAPRLGEYLDHYMDARRTELQPGTLELHETSGRYLLGHFGETVRLSEIDRAAARGFRTALCSGELLRSMARAGAMEDGEDPESVEVRPLRPSTVNMHLRNARTIFQVAVADDLMLFNPFDRIGQVETPRTEWHYVTAEEFDRLMAASRPAWQVLMALARWAALRRSEAINLRWSNVDWQRGRLTIIANDQWRPKDVDGRIVPMPQRLRTLLATAKSKPGSRELVIPGGAIIEQNVWRDFGVICGRAGVVRYSKPLHALRKSCLTDWAGEFPMHVVQEWAGHASIETTRDYYLRVDDVHYQRAASADSPADRPKTRHKTTEHKAKRAASGSRRNGRKVG